MIDWPKYTTVLLYPPIEHLRIVMERMQHVMNVPYASYRNNVEQYYAIMQRKKFCAGAQSTRYLRINIVIHACNVPSRHPRTSMNTFSPKGWTNSPPNCGNFSSICGNFSLRPLFRIEANSVLNLNLIYNHPFDHHKSHRSLYAFFNDGSKRHGTGWITCSVSGLSCSRLYLKFALQVWRK